MHRICLLIVITMVVVSTSCAQNETTLFTLNTVSADVYVLPERQQSGNVSILIGTTPEMIEKYAPDGTFSSAVNAFLVCSNGMKTIIDTGFGTQLFTNLQQLHILPEQIDAVLLTHAHGDHIGGLILNGGKAAFPQARLYVAQKEYDYWTSDQAMNLAPENRRNGFINARAVFNAYNNRLILFTPTDIEKQSEPLIAGIYGVKAYGHTPGHTAYIIDGGNEKILIWGDITHAMAVQMPYPNVAVTYDVDPEEAIVTRKKILNYAAENAIIIAGMHIAYPSIGKLIPDGDGYFFEKCINKTAVRNAISRQMNAYPKSRLQDIYKNFFQDYWGAEHLITDTTAVAEYLRMELNSVESFTGADAEPTGWEGNYYRMNLRLIKENRISFDDFINAFIAGATQIQTPPMEAWIYTWNEIVKIIDDMRLNIPDYQIDKDKIIKMLQTGHYAVHHSQTYNQYYAPHYRIIKKERYLTLAKTVENL